MCSGRETGIGGERADGGGSFGVGAASLTLPSKNLAKRLPFTIPGSKGSFQLASEGMGGRSLRCNSGTPPSDGDSRCSSNGEKVALSELSKDAIPLVRFNCGGGRLMDVVDEDA